MGKTLKNFRNDKERIAFLEDYTNKENGWFLFRNDPEMKRRCWLLDLPEGASLIVEEELRTFTWPEEHQKWNVLTWFIIDDWTEQKPFGDCRGSRTQALNKLKELGRKKK